MKLAGRRDLPFPRSAVWAALMDPDVLSRTLPGCERLERTGEGGFAGTLSVAVGPVRGRFDGTLELTEVEPPEGYRMRLHGEGPSGFMTGEGTVRLEDAAAGGGTALLYDLEAQVGGRIAGVGQRLLDSSAKVIARQGLDGLERQLAARHGTAEAGTAAVGTPGAAAVAAPAEGGGRPAAEALGPAGAGAGESASTAGAGGGAAVASTGSAATDDRAGRPPAVGTAGSSSTAASAGGAPGSTPIPAAGQSTAPSPAGPPSPAAPAGPTATPPAVPSAAARPAAASRPPASGGPAAPEPTTPGPLAPAPSQSEFAGQFLRGLWEEMVPPAARPWVVAGAVLLLALLVLLLAWLLT